MLNAVENVPLYKKVENKLLDYIERKKAPVLPKESDLMELFGVSRNTLRRAVLELSGQGILKPVQGHGTLVVKYAGLEKQDIGVVLTDDLKLTDPWVAAIMDGMREALTYLGYNLHLFMCHEYSIAPSNNSVFSHLMSTDRLLGIILLSSLNPGEIQFFAKNELIFLSVNFKYHDIQHPFVNYDFEGAYSRILEHFYHKGFRRIAWLREAARAERTDPCEGAVFYIKSAFARFFEAKQLPPDKVDCEKSIGEQLRALYENRTEVVIVASLSARAEVDEFVSEHPDWQPIIVKSYLSGEKTRGPAIIFNPEDLGREAGILFLRLINNKTNRTPVLIQPELLL